MRRVVICLVVLWVSGSVFAEVEPLEVPIGEMVEGIACHTDPAQTYTLYMPSTYTRDLRLPVLLIFDPRGRSLLAAELFREAAETYGWIIVSSDNTRSDGPWEPNLLAIQALWPEIHARIPADFQRIYASGFSGGVAVATVLARTTGEIAGIIGCGGLNMVNQLDDRELPFFSTAGNTDFNFSEMNRLDDFLAEQGNPHRLVIFEGSHTWMPPEVARDAVEWMELNAMRRGTRDRDQGLISRLYFADLEGARSAVEDGQTLVAARRFREMERTYAGMHDTSEVQTVVDRIEASDPYRLQLKRAKRIQGFEDKCLERRNAELTRLRSSDVPPPTAQLAGNLHIRDLLRDAREPDDQGFAAQRCLNSLYSSLSFYLPLDDLPKQRYAQVAASYELALMIRDDHPVVWYNLACVRALLGQRKGAMEALEKAVENGFRNTELLASDTDLDPLRKRDDFKTLLGSLIGNQ
jgi:predicted esterase